MKYTLILCLLIVIAGCTREREYPEVKKLTEYKKTDFVITPQTTLSKNKNAIYTPTMLYAWNEIKNIAAGDVQIDSKFGDLMSLNHSTSFQNTLRPGEYKTDVQMANGLIEITSEFSKSLPFDKIFVDYKNLLEFRGQKVQSFGCTGTDFELLQSVSLLHYNNDDDFIVRIVFKDIQHEMLLCLTKKSPVTLEELFNHIDAKTKAGRAHTVKNSSNYKLSAADELIIPKLIFNIANNYRNLVGNTFIADNNSFTIKKAYQRTAFVLDESGAAAQSEARLTADSLSVEEVKAKPKKLHFNKPFLIMLKRKDSPNPYFAMWVDNTELMQKN